MLSYKQRLKDKPSKREIRMDNFDLYADLPPLTPVEDKDKPPALSSQNISTMQKHPYLTRRSSVVPNDQTSILDKSTEQATHKTSEKKMLEVIHKKQVREFDEQFLLNPSANDCMQVLPQNTVPMAKYRKKYIQKKKTREHAEIEGILTDEEIWRRRKSKEEDERMAIVRGRHHRGSKLDWDATALGFGEQNPEKKSLQEEIYKPTYVIDADLEEETLFSAIGKNIPRRKIAVVSTLMQKIEKKKQEKQEREFNERMLSTIYTEEQQKQGNGKEVKNPDPEQSASTSEKSDPDESQETTSVKKIEENDTNKSAAQISDGIEQVVNSELDSLSLSTVTNAELSSETPGDKLVLSAVPGSLTNEEKDLQDSKPAVPDQFLFYTSENAGPMSLDAMASPPENLLDTRTLISYSEMLMASAKHHQKSLSMMNLSEIPEEDVHIDYLYIPSLMESGRSSFPPQEMYGLPPKVGEFSPPRIKHQYVKRAKSTGNLYSDSSGQVDPTTGENLYARIRKPSGSSSAASKRRRRSSVVSHNVVRKSGSAQPRHVRKNRIDRLSRSSSSNDIVLLHRLASIVEQQNEIIYQWQKSGNLDQSGRSRHKVIRRRSLSVGSRPISKRTEEDDLRAKNISQQRFYKYQTARQDSTTSLSSYGGGHEIQTTFDDLTYNNSLSETDTPSRVSTKRREVADSTLQNPHSPEEHLDEAETGQEIISNLDSVPITDTGLAATYSRVRTPNGHVYNEREVTAHVDVEINAARNTRETKNPSDGDSVNTNFERQKETSPITEPRLNPTGALQPGTRSSSRCEIAGNRSSVIQIDVIKSSGVDFPRNIDSRLSITSTRTNKSRSSIESRSFSRHSRQKSLIRVKGIRNQPRENEADLKQKVQAVVNAGTGTDNSDESEGWWVLWSKRESDQLIGEASGFFKKVKSFFGIAVDEASDNNTVVAELIEKFPGESAAECQEIANDIITKEAKQNEESALSSAEDVMQNTTIEDSATGFRRSKATRRKKSSPSKYIIKAKTAQSNTGNVTNKGALPTVYTSSQQKPKSKHAKLKHKQRSVDSGFCTNPTDDDSQQTSV